ncbi:MAG: PIN domain-containing protein [Acidobacteria bacterium]|nr:PIN domain-containing protein [Acidobacteriota bacterium]
MSSRVYLLDTSVLIASSTTDHAMHDRAIGWINRRHPHFATCPITQGALVRYHCLAGGPNSITTAKEVLRNIVARPGHVFWPDDISYAVLPVRGLRGHKQVTDFYLVALAGKNGGRVATMDESLAAFFPEVCELI